MIINERNTYQWNKKKSRNKQGFLATAVRELCTDLSKVKHDHPKEGSLRPLK